MVKIGEIPRQKMRKQKPEERKKNFNEVPLGYTEEEAVIEAGRCLQCPKPLCVDGCPVEVDIPKFIQLVTEKKYIEAVEVIKETNTLPAICGRVCPQEDQCELTCVLGKKFEPVAIGRLERFAADYEAAHKEDIKAAKKVSKINKKVAVVGSGPAGLTVASELAKKGYEVTIFEALHKPGGVLTYGIPEFRLPKSIVARECKYVESLGVDLKCDYVIGKILTVDELFTMGYEAVFLGNGAGLPRFMGIPGENLVGVYSANEFLTRVNLMKAYKFPEYVTPVKKGNNVVVVGGGNVTMDSARTALRLGAAKVYDVYRRSRKEMPAREEEIVNAEEEGIIFNLLTNPVRIIGNEKDEVEEVECIKMELGEPDDSGRRRPIPIEGSEFRIKADVMIEAIGTKANPLIADTSKDLKINQWGYIVTDEETCMTSKKGVFAGGDIVTGSATVILAMGTGRLAAKNIDKYLKDNTFC